MEWQELLSLNFGLVQDTLERALDGVSEEDLNWQPHPESNSMSWLTWHLTRVQDNLITLLMGQQELWVKDGWYTRFGLPFDARDFGLGHKLEDLARFKSADVRTLLGYHRAVFERTRAYLATLTSASPGRVVEGTPFRPPTEGMVLASVLNDNIQHAGQVAYLRGLRYGMGWQRY